MLDLSTILTVGVGFAAFLSPLAVASLNNRHQRKLKEIELEHALQLKKLELEHNFQLREAELAQRTYEKQLDITYQSKKSAFINFIDATGRYYLDMENEELFAAFSSCAYNAAMLCVNPQCRSSIASFVTTASKRFVSTVESSSNYFIRQMDYISYVLQIELYGKNPTDK